MKNRLSILISILALFMIASCGSSPKYKNVVQVNQQPAIWPEYADVTVPVGIAPLNFNFTAGTYKWLFLTLKGSVTGQYETEGKVLDIDIDAWHTLLEQNKGGYLDFSLSVVASDNRVEYSPFRVYVSSDPLDEYGLTYRLVEPGYIGYGMMGIYQRNLSNFDQEPIFESRMSANSCVNCHTPNKTNSDQCTFHVRGPNGFTLVKDGDDTRIFDMRTDKTIANCVYPYWHHTGRYIAYSQNQTFQVFHAAHKNKIEVFDQNSDLAIYDVENRELILSPQVMKDSIAETFPAFSADGKTLFYCQAPKIKPPMYLEDVRYCLMQVPFNEATGKVVGEPDTLLGIVGKSVTLPRPSYDGRYILVTVADYGTFPIWHHEADLYLIDLRDSTVKPATALNSNDTEAFHNWSANSRWVVFSSRRNDGLYTKLYLAHMDEEGNFSKPFLLPQKNPVKYYNELFYSYNTPDFCDKPVDISKTMLRAAANSQEREHVRVR